VLRKIFGSEEDKGTAEWKGLHKEDAEDLYSPNTIRVIKAKKN
jgi:hypothetical protein